VVRKVALKAVTDVTGEAVDGVAPEVAGTAPQGVWMLRPKEAATSFTGKAVGRAAPEETVADVLQAVRTATSNGAETPGRPQAGRAVGDVVGYREVWEGEVFRG
jgi:hypothetical protein